MIDTRNEFRQLRLAVYAKCNEEQIPPSYRRNIDGALHGNRHFIGHCPLREIAEKVMSHIHFLLAKAHYYDVERHEIAPVNYKPWFHYKGHVTRWLKPGEIA